MATSRFLRDPIRTVTIAGNSPVGGTTDTVISIYPDSTLRFIDGNGVTQVVPMPARYTTDYKNGIQPRSDVVTGSPAEQLYALVDALMRRAVSET